MELRVLRYFLAATEEGTISRAAAVSHVSQPTLSRQLRDLENELGCVLFERGPHGIVLTDEGRYLRDRAAEMVAIADGAEAELKGFSGDIGGLVSIGAGESEGMAELARAMAAFSAEHPAVRFSVHSGNARDVLGRLDQGTVDFALLVGGRAEARHEGVRLPADDVWGVVARRGSALAAKEGVRREDLTGVPVIASAQERATPSLGRWFGEAADDIDVAATYNLAHNAALMVAAGMGVAVTLEHLVECTEESGLSFIPLDPPVRAGNSVVWLRDRTPSRAARLFRDELLRRYR